MKKKEGLSGNPEQSAPMPEKAAAPRRGALKRLAAGGAAAGVLAALPSRWTRPVVDTVLLPAHAQTSVRGTEDGDFFQTGTAQPGVQLERSRLYEEHSSDTRFARSLRPRWLGWLFRSAQAGSRDPGSCSDCGMCARLRSEEVTLTAVRRLSLDDPSDCYEATGRVGDTVSFAHVEGGNFCNVPGDNTIVRLEGETPNRLLILDDGGGEFHLHEDPTRTCNCGELLCPF